MPAHYPELSGVSKTCEKCSKECKQWKQIKVVICPNYKSVELQSREKATL